MEGATICVEIHLLIIQAHLLEDCRLQVADVVRAVNGFVTDIVGGAFDHATLHAATGEQRRKSLAVVIPPRCILRPWRPAEFAGEDDECVVEQAPLFQIGDQAGDGFVDCAAKGTVRCHVAVGVPGSIPAAGVTDLDETDAVLDQTAGEKELPSKLVGFLSPDAVEGFDVVGFGGNVDNGGGGAHQIARQFIGLKAGGDFGIKGVVGAELPVPFGERLHLPVTIGAVGGFGRKKVRDRGIAGLKRSRRTGRAQIAAGKLDGRGRPADIDEGRQILVR